MTERRVGTVETIHASPGPYGGRHGVIVTPEGDRFIWSSSNVYRNFSTLDLGAHVTFAVVAHSYATDIDRTDKPTRVSFKDHFDPATLVLHHGGPYGACPFKVSIEPPRFLYDHRPLQTTTTTIYSWRCIACGTSLTLTVPRSAPRDRLAPRVTPANPFAGGEMP
jgi:hypothetical protein